MYEVSGLIGFQTGNVAHFLYFWPQFFVKHVIINEV